MWNHDGIARSLTTALTGLGVLAACGGSTSDEGGGSDAISGSGGSSGGDPSTGGTSASGGSSNGGGGNVAGSGGDVGGGGDGPVGCTLIGCNDGFQILFDKATAWGQGDYEVRLTVDDVETTCTASMPLDCNAPHPCGDENLGFTVIQSGCALDPSDQELGGVEFYGITPTDVEIEVWYESTQIASEKYDVSYEQIQPNGPMCEPICMVAPEIRLPLP